MLRYKDYQLIKPDVSTTNQISRLILSNDGSVFHEVMLNRIMERRFNTELLYLVDNRDNIKSAAPVHIIKNKYGLKKYNIRPLNDIPYSGFIGEKIVDKNDFNTGFFESVVYVGFPYIHEDSDKEYPVWGETTMVDLSLSEDEIFSKLIHSKRRNMIRKAVKEGIEIKSFFALEGLDLYWPILKQLHDKLGYNDLTYDYYKEIFQKYAPLKQAFILLAFKDEQAISGVFILGNKNYMHYYKGASVFGVKNQGQGELLQWEAIKLSKSLGTKFYDLCNLNKDSLPDIYRFKTGISKDIYHYQILSNNAFGYKVVNKISKYL